MFRLLIPCLIWLSSVRSESAMSAMMPMSDGAPEEKAAMKRESYFNPCPPAYAHPIPYQPATEIFVKPYPQPVPIQYAPKPMITYVKSSVEKPAPVIEKPAPVIVKPIVQQKLVYPIYQKPALSYAPIYQKPMYYAPMYEKLMYQAPKIYLKKFELPISQEILKPQLAYPVHYQSPPKVVQISAPQINYAKIPQAPLYHAPPQPVYQSVIKPYCP